LRQKGEPGCDYARVLFIIDLLGAMLSRIALLRTPEKLNMEESMEMSFLSLALLQRSNAYEEHGDVFFVPLYTLDRCPENRDESNGNSIIKLWLQFIPIFGALHSQLPKGHSKKDIPMFHAE
jgi:hypothetical protein